MTRLSVRPGAGTQPAGGRAVMEDPETRRILDAAWTVLRRSNFRSLKVRQVLTESSTSASSFYRRFPSKSHLLLALLQNEVRLVDERMRVELAPARTATEQLQAWLRFILGNIYHRSRAERTRMFLDPVLLEELPTEVHLLHQVANSHLSEIIRRGMRDGEFRAGDPETDALLVRHMVRGLLDDGLAGVLPLDEEHLVAQVHGFVLRALRTE